MVVVLAAALFVRSLRNLETADPGFQRRGVLVMQLMAQPGRQPTSNRGSYYRELVNKINRLPGVVATSFSVMGPVNRGESKEPVVAESSNLSPEQSAGDVVGPGFFQMIGMRLLAGREFTWRDDETAPPVTVISQSLAARLFPAGGAVGRYVIVDPGVNQRRLQIVGVVNSASLWRIQHKEPEAIYYPLLQEGPTGAYLDIRSAGNASAISGAAAKIVEDMGHEYPLYIQTLEERIARMTVDEHMIAWLSGFFGGLAMLLACIGIYGLMSDSVARRRPEIGLRMALGAERSNVVRMVLSEALLLGGAGIVIGIPAALVVTRSIGGLLFGVSAADPQTITIAASTLFGVAAFAGYLPARLASRIDPMATLKIE
jgi:predicted permease